MASKWYEKCFISACRRVFPRFRGFVYTCVYSGVQLDSPPKGKHMPIVVPSKSNTDAARRLEELRMKSATKVHKDDGDPEKIREESLRVFKALEPARKRANESCR